MRNLIALVTGLAVLAFAYWHLSPKVMEKPVPNVIERLFSEEPDPEIIVPKGKHKCPKKFKYFCI
jgi:hypothetical protein